MKPAVAVLAACLVALPACGVQRDPTGRVPGTAGALASDSTGMKLVAAGSGLWTSTNGGALWTDKTPSGLKAQLAYSAVASDQTGTNLVAAVSGFTDSPSDNPAAFDGDIWTSSDGGETWKDQTASSPASGQEWRSVASDATGTKLVAVSYGSPNPAFPMGGIWTSTDAGATWRSQTGGLSSLRFQSWQSVASDSTGKNLVVAGQTGLWTSVDSGATWTNRTPTTSDSNWWSVASDATGLNLVVVEDGGSIWTSTDGGVTWAATSQEVWFSVASDSTGKNLVAVDGLVDGYNGDIWTSTDAGATWTNLTANDPAADAMWTAVVSNASGSHLVAIGNGAIWTN